MIPAFSLQVIRQGGADGIEIPTLTSLKGEGISLAEGGYDLFRNHGHQPA